jgi:hypothetical protein
VLHDERHPDGLRSSEERKMKAITAVRAILAGVTVLAANFVAGIAPTEAACTFDTQVVFHGLGSWFENCPDAQPVNGYSYLISDPAGTNSAGQDFVCEDATGFNSIGIQCQPEAGIPGDGHVTVLYDWGNGNTGAVGCPNPYSMGDGTTPIAVQVMAGNNASLVVTLGFLESLAGFLVEQAQPLNASMDGADPISCTAANGVMGTGARTPTSACVNVPVPTIMSDCDPGTVGDALGLCAAGGTTRPATARGRLYTIQAACGSTPDPLVTHGWTLLASQPDASGDACNGGLPNPVAGACNFIGATGMIGGTETPAMIGWLALDANTNCIDNDQDGYAANCNNFCPDTGKECGPDCNDNDPAINPGAAEICNNIDDNCNGSIDDGTITCGVGACARTVNICVNGQPQTCVPGTPTTEICNGIDDNCNGQVDEGLGPITCGIGACARTVISCINGQPQTCIPGTPSFEYCNGIDDNCNGQVDEGTTSCGVGACMRTVNTCIDGHNQSCIPGSPSPEICNGIDDNCNGAVDEGFGTTTCGIGACARTVNSCTNGQPQTCVPGTPSPEICNGMDDNCDGQIDEGFGSTTCGVGRCARTVNNCVSGQPQTCVPGTPLPETCNGIDDNCNGLVDENLGTTTCGLGPCTRTVVNCVNGQPQACVQGTPSPEVCNGIDDNCNGLIDDDDAGIDSDGDGIHNACDNCRFAYNPDQADYDQDGIGNSCDNCVFTSNPDQADLDDDHRGDSCDNCPRDYNLFQDDYDDDNVGDVCDNCPFDKNTDQGDVNHDGVGDVCDLNDGLILIDLPDEITVEWQQETGFETFNWYRGVLSVLSGSGLYTQDPNLVPLASRDCGMLDAYTFDVTDPPVGQGLFFLVTGVHLGVEGSLGTNSAGVQRPNANPCP